MGFIGLIGSYEHTIDSHGRLSIPVKFRDYINAYSEGSVVMTTSHVDSCVVVYPLPAWKAVTERWEKSETATDKPENDFAVRKDFWRLFSSGAEDTSLDKQGRVLLPAHLREYAGLDRDTVLVGFSTFFEIWNMQKWQKKKAGLLENKERLQEAMTSLRI